MRKTIKLSAFRFYKPLQNWPKVLLLSFLAFSCGKKEENTSEKPKTRFDPSQVSAIGRIEPAKKIIQLSAEVSGVVKQILVEAGDSVKAGQKLIEMTTE